MSTPLPNWTRRDNFRVPPHQALVDAVNETGNITPPDGLSFHRTPKGSGFTDEAEHAYTDPVVLVKLTTTATRGGVYNGEIWDAPQAGDFDPATSSPTAEADLGAVGDVVIVINREELGADSHDLIDAGGNVTPPGIFEAVYLLTNDDGTDVYTIEVPPPGPVRLYVTAILSGAGAKYTVQRLPPPGADVDDSSDAVLADLGTPDGVDAIGIDVNELGRAAHSHLNSPGDVVEGRLLRTNGDGTRVYTFAEAPGAGDVFRVNVSQVGGSNGGPAAAASYTYDVLAVNGETLGSAVAVAMARADGLVTAGTVGTAHYTAAGVLVLDFVDEVDDTDPECTP